MKEIKIEIPESILLAAGYIEKEYGNLDVGDMSEIFDFLIDGGIRYELIIKITKEAKNEKE